MPTLPSLDLAAALPCHRCGYDVRAQPADGDCPECRASVQESRRLAAIPRRPAWRDSDPRWRRRMICGAWVLTLVPLTEVLRAFRWSREIPAPTFLHVEGQQPLEATLLPWVFPYLAFCVGIALLFSKERRRATPLGWTRRWGVIGSYLVLVLGFVHVAMMPALVMLGVAASFYAIADAHRPPVTPWLAWLSTGYLRYGPHQTWLSFAALAAASAMLVLFASVALFDALRRCGNRWVAAIALGPLVASAAIQAAVAVHYATFRFPNVVFRGTWIESRGFYFDSQSLAEGIAMWVRADLRGWSALRSSFYLELSKWLACLTIALWLTIAQLLATVRRPKPTTQTA